MKKIGTINIVNHEYTIYLYDDYDEINKSSQEYNLKYLGVSKEDEKCSGYCVTTTKEIHIYTGFGDVYTDETLNHEIWHAFLYEIGYQHWGDEEFIQKLTLWDPIVRDVVNQGKGLIKNVRD